MAKKQVPDHISGVAQGNLNAAQTLFGIDAQGLKNASPEAIAVLTDMMEDAQFWAKNGRKLRQQIETIVQGTAEKTITLGMIASAVQKAGTPIIKAKFEAALAEKKFGNFLNEAKDKAAHQFGMENARHQAQMGFQRAEQNLQNQIFIATTRQRYNQLRMRADSANKQIQNNHNQLRVQGAFQLGSDAPFLAKPHNVSRPVVSTPTTVTGALGAGLNADAATRRGLFGFIGRAVERVRKFLGV